MNQMTSMFRVDGKVALVVGAGSGIGQAAAVALGQSGAAVVCADLNLQAAQETADTIAASGKASAVPIDIRSGASIGAAMETIRADYGRLDIMVSTPAINVRKRLLTYTEEELDRVVDLNLKGNFRITKASAELMSAGGAGGSIILTSSIRSLVVEPGQGVYAATKASQVQLARGFAVELAPLGIRVNALAPGVVDTPLTAPIRKNTEWYAAYANRNAMKRWASPEEMAWPIVFLASPASSYMTGAVLFVDGGWTAIDGRFEPPL